MAVKVKTYIPLIVLSIVAIACLSFAEVERSDMRCTDMFIVIEKNKSHSDFITVDDVYDLLQTNRNQMIGNEIKNIDIHEIESLVEQNPMVLDCETYTTIKGELYIRIKQRTPIVRVLDGTDSYYIDEEGVKMPMSRHASARVVVASGNVSEKNIPTILSFVREIKKDELLSPMIEQIYVTNQSEYVLVSKVGPAKIDFGDADNFERKFRYIRTFYTADKVRENWQNYERISVKFNNQIVCTKKLK